MTEERFIETYEKYNKDIYRLAYSYTLNKSDAEDITQRTFIKYFKNINKINEDKIKSWLIITTINECKDLFKNIWNKKVIKTEDEIIIKTKDNNENIQYYINQLPKQYRIIFHLFYYYGYKTKEIAKLTNIKETTIRQKLRRGREILKLEKEDIYE